MAFQFHSSEFAVAGPPLAEAYDKVAARYKSKHRRFLNWVGGSGRAALAGAVTALLQPGTRVLDARCGTGDLAAEVKRVQPVSSVTLMDGSEAMLRQAPVGLGRKVLGDVSDMPFASATHDLSVCSFVLECVEDPEKVVRELLRVTRPGGHVCIAFCCESGPVGWRARMMRWVMARRGLGQFLRKERVVSAFKTCRVTDLREVADTGSVCVLVATR